MIGEGVYNMYNVFAKEGVELSFELMRNGNAANKLESYVEASNQL